MTQRFIPEYDWENAKEHDGAAEILEERKDGEMKREWMKNKEWS